MHRYLFENMDEVVHAVMKLSSANDIARAAGEKLLGAKGRVGNVFRRAGEIGTEFAKGVGVKPENAESVGKTLGYGTVGGAGLYVANKARRKTQDFRRRHNFGSDPYYGPGY